MGSTYVEGVWAKEARDFPPDPVTGARITRLSGSSVRTENIYCDSPRATADGRRFASQRYIDGLFDTRRVLLVHDLKTKLTALIDRDIRSVPISPAWGGCVYYLRGNQFMRASLETLKTEPVLELDPLPFCWQPMSISTDERYFLYTTLLQESPGQYNLVRVDLRDKTWKMIFDKPEPSRCGGAFNPVTGHDMLIATTYWDGEKRFGVGLLADSDGQNRREVFREVHHSTWLGNTGKFAALLAFDYESIRHKPEHPDGELYIWSADGTPPRLIPCREHLFNHISSSRCGRYVVCESLESGLEFSPVPIVVVNVVTGKHRVLVSDTHNSGGGDSGRGVNPYFTADMKHVIYNADPDGIVNVFAAEIPEGSWRAWSRREPWSMWTNETWFRDADLWTRQGWYGGTKDLAARNARVIRGIAQLLFDNIRTNLPDPTRDDVVRRLETSNRQRLDAVPSLSKYPELRGMRELVKAMWRGWRDGAELDAAPTRVRRHSQAIISRKSYREEWRSPHGTSDSRRHLSLRHAQRDHRAEKRRLPRRVLPDELELVSRPKTGARLERILAQMRQTLSTGQWP